MRVRVAVICGEGAVLAVAAASGALSWRAERCGALLKLWAQWDA